MIGLAMVWLGACGGDGWSTEQTLLLARYGHSATTLANGDVIVVGGVGSGDGVLPHVERWYADRGAFEPGPALAGARAFHTATLLADGRVLVVGGAVGDLPIRETELFDPDVGTWSAGPTLGRGRVHHSATLLPDGAVVVHGGHLDPRAEGPVRWSPGDADWTRLDVDVDDVRQHHRAVAHGDDVLVVGGVGVDGVLTSAALLDASGGWDDAGALERPRAFHALAEVDDGVILAGGASDAEAIGQSDDVLRWDGASWTQVGELQAPRADPVATPLGGGAVLLTGGRAGSGTSPLADLYDPELGTTVTAAPMATGRVHHAAAVLRDGRVLVVGGFGGLYALDHVEIYQPTARHRR